MTPDEATGLATRIGKIHGRHLLTHSEWVAKVLPLDAGTAGAALMRCLDIRNGPPTITEFDTAYATVKTPHNDPIPHRDCPTCSDGYVTRWVVAHGYPGRYAFACGCRTVANPTRPPHDAHLTVHAAWHDPAVSHQPPACYAAPPPTDDLARTA